MRLGSAFKFLEWAAGGFLVGYINDQFISPLGENLLPALQTNHTLSKATDATTTGLTAWGGGKLGGLIHPRVGEAIENGGFVLAGMKAIATLVPNTDVKVGTPNFLGFLRSSGASPQVIAQAASQMAGGAGALPATGAAAPPALPAGVPASYIVSGIGAQTSSTLSTGY